MIQRTGATRTATVGVGNPHLHADGLLRKNRLRQTSVMASLGAMKRSRGGFGNL